MVLFLIFQLLYAEGGPEQDTPQDQTFQLNCKQVTWAVFCNTCDSYFDCENVVDQLLSYLIVSLCA